MSRTVCGICWCPYDEDTGACACPPGMNFKPQDFTRCSGNPCFDYCKACERNVSNSPVNPQADRQWYMGPWVIEDEKCPSFIGEKNG